MEWFGREKIRHIFHPSDDNYIPGESLSIEKSSSHDRVRHASADRSSNLRGRRNI